MIWLLLWANKTLAVKIIYLYDNKKADMLNDVGNDENNQVQYIGSCSYMNTDIAVVFSYILAHT